MFIYAKQILFYCHIPHPQCLLLLYLSAVMDLFPTIDLLPDSSFVILQSLVLSKIFLVSSEGLRMTLPLPSDKGRSSTMTFRTIEWSLFLCGKTDEIGRVKDKKGVIMGSNESVSTHEMVWQITKDYTKTEMYTPLLCNNLHKTLGTSQ